MFGRSARNVAAGGAAVVIAVVGGFALGRTTAPERGGSPDTTSTSVAASSGLMRLLTGTWEHHGFHMFIGSNGAGEFTWRTYRSCPPDTPPCDLPNEESGWADFQLTPVSAAVAEAQVGGTTDPTVVPASTFRVQLDEPHDTLKLSIPPGASTTMCGPHASGPNVVNCGA